MRKIDYTNRKHLPTMEELPYEDDRPADSEVQVVILNLLRELLAYIWEDRDDWFFGVRMGWYYDPDQSAIAPHGFLSLGVPRIKGEHLRLSYVTWEENGVIPAFALEIVSITPTGEYKQKKRIYAEYGVMYYVIYAPRRKGKRKLALYRLNARGKYELQNDNPLWMPEIGLGIGTEIGTFHGVTREWLYWYDRLGNRYSSPGVPKQGEHQIKFDWQGRHRLAEQQLGQERLARELAEQQLEQERLARELAERQAQIERQRAEQLAARLQELGIDPDRS